MSAEANEKEIFYDYNEFAARMKMSRRTVETLVSERIIKPIRIRGRCYFREYHVKELLDHYDPRAKKGNGDANG
jgi:hypothetical protein